MKETKDHDIRRKGAIGFDADRFATIYLSEQADGTTLPHEAGHLFLQMYTDLAHTPGVNDTLKRDYQQVLEWFGLTDEQWQSMSLSEQRPYHERFADAYMLYVAVRQSATPGAHREFELWLGAVQRQMGTTPKPAGQFQSMFERMVPPIDRPNQDSAVLASVRNIFSMTSASTGHQTPDGVAAILAATYQRMQAVSGIEPVEFLNRYGFGIERITPTAYKSTMSPLRSTRASEYQETRQLLNQFVGTSAAVPGIGAKLDQAREMLAKNRTSRSIHQETGWFLGFDNRWRYEISDEQARLKIDWPPPIIGQEYYLCDALDHDALFQAYPALAGLRLTTSQPDAGHSAAFYERLGLITVDPNASPAKALSSVTHEIQHWIQSRENHARGGSNHDEFMVPLYHSMQHSRQARQEELAIERRHFNDLLSELEKNSQLLCSANLLVCANRLVSYAHRDSPSGVLRHIRNCLQSLYCERLQECTDTRRQANELQRSFMDLPPRHKLRERNSFLSEVCLGGAKIIKQAVWNRHLRQIEADGRDPEKISKSLERKVERGRERLAPYYSLKRRVEQDDKFVRRTEKELYRDVLYFSLAGEIEARNTQYRAHMTPEERALQYPDDTADTPASEAIVTFGRAEFTAPSRLQEYLEAERERPVPIDEMELDEVELDHISENEDHAQWQALER